jgi:hypothetical protein
MQMLRQAQQRERQMMQEFSLLAEEHVNAVAAPLQDARQALEQVHTDTQNMARMLNGNGQWPLIRPTMNIAYVKRIHY